MTRKRHWLVVGTLAAAGLSCLAGALALAQLSTQAALRQYEQRLAQLDKNDPDAVYELAKWSYQNSLRDEAIKLAIEANSKAPDDVRPKFLVYTITHAGQLKGEVEGGEGAANIPTVSDDEVQRVLADEGADVIHRFRSVQGVLFGLCASPGCHSVGNPNAPFVVVRLNATSDKTLVQNFLAINPYCDREKPDQSRLLTVPVAGPPTHPSRPIRSSSEPVYRTIITWIDTLKTEGDILWTQPPTAPPPAVEQK
ncbi:MAG TPA: hypothetical protein VMY35_01130 [Phycisphaerae bacterium]|nr:hypothetical protein [Phycisphaerae bacterium]